MRGVTVVAPSPLVRARISHIAGSRVPRRRGRRRSSVRIRRHRRFLDPPRVRAYGVPETFREVGRAHRWVRDLGRATPSLRHAPSDTCFIDRTLLRPLATIASRVLRLALALLALFEPVAVAVHFQDVDVVGSAGRAARRSASRIRTRRSTRRTAVLGTTITPYCFFWQASQEAEDERVDPAAHAPLAAPEETLVRFDTYIGMGYSNVISLFIIVSTAATLTASGIYRHPNLPQAAEALRPIAGAFTFALFAAGIIGIGLPAARAPTRSTRRSAGPPASTVSRSMLKRSMAPSRCSL
jgi:hypothetical protein